MMEFLDALNETDLPAWLTDFVIPGVSALVMLVVAFIVAGWVKRLTFKALSKANVEMTLTKFFANFARYVVLIVAVVAILGRIGVETASFAAILAAAGFAIGLAFQGTLSNFSAGVMLLVFRPFKVGDLVQVNDITGHVEEIELFTTQLNTPDNRRMIVPNGTIFGSSIENMTFHTKRRVDVSVGTDYGADLKQTRAVLVSAAESIEGRMKNEPCEAYLVGLGGSSIDWEVRLWCDPNDYLALKDQLTEAVKYKLDEAGIGIPFPQMDVHVDQV